MTYVQPSYNKTNIICTSGLNKVSITCTPGQNTNTTILGSSSFMNAINVVSEIVTLESLQQ